MKQNHLQLIGCASGLAGKENGCGDGPAAMARSAFLKNNNYIIWKKMLKPSLPKESERLDQSLAILYDHLAREVCAALKDSERVCVMGGDHTSAIGTWSGVHEAIKNEGDLGLIWIDAHMDSHTPETTPSGRIHGMPLAVLLGYGYDTLTSVMHAKPKVKPENVCLIGVRSFEEGEATLLERLNVRVYLMEEVRERGLMVVLNEAMERVSKHTVGFGVSLDVDGIDPIDAPGVDVPEPNGISAADMCEGLEIIMQHPTLIATEIVEFDPAHDVDQKTEKLVATMLGIISRETSNENITC